jgi:hypothetical protein
MDSLALILWRAVGCGTHTVTASPSTDLIHHPSTSLLGNTGDLAAYSHAASVGSRYPVHLTPSAHPTVILSDQDLPSL